MRERVNVAQLAIFHAEEMRIGSAAAAVWVSGPEGAEHDDRTDRLIHHEATVRDVHTSRDSDITGVSRAAGSEVPASFDALAGNTPWHEVRFLFEKCIEV